MHPYEYNLSLRFRHPDQDLGTVFSELHKIKGFQIGRAWKAGEPRKDLRGNKLEGNYKDSYCYFKFFDAWQKSNQASLVDKLEEILEQLSPFKKDFQEFVQNGGSIGFYISFYITENAGEIFSLELIRRLSDFNMELSFDMYPPDSESSLKT